MTYITCYWSDSYTHLGSAFIILPTELPLVLNSQCSRINSFFLCCVACSACYHYIWISHLWSANTLHFPHTNTVPPQFSSSTYFGVLILEISQFYIQVKAIENIITNENYQLKHCTSSRTLSNVTILDSHWHFTVMKFRKNIDISQWCQHLTFSRMWNSWIHRCV